MKRTSKTTTIEYDDKGNKIRETIEDVTEEDSNGTIYPQYPTYPYGYPQFWYGNITCDCNQNMDITKFSETLKENIKLNNPVTK